MALLTCKNCGKKVSDTIENCIHCGSLLTEIKSNDFANDAEEIIEETVKETELFSHLSEEKQNVLLNEFASSSTWVQKYLTTLYRSSLMAKYSSVCFLFSVITITILLNFKPYLRELILSFSPGKEIFIISIIALAALCLIALVNYIIKKIRFSRENAKYIYMKKLQKWLLECKGIEYTPYFKRRKETRKFDSITIDN